MIKTLIFDLGGVIVPFDFVHAYTRMETLSGLTREQIRERLLEGDFVRNYEAGRIPTDDFVKEVNRRLGIAVQRDEFREIWVSIFARQTLLPESLFATLRRRYRLLLLSNTNEMHFDWVAENYPHLSHFHHRVVSHKVGALKPEDAIYRAALSQAECEPGECFFTDDIAPYVEGARQHGMQAVQFTGRDKLLVDLQKLGVEV